MTHSHANETGEGKLRETSQVIDGGRKPDLVSFLVVLLNSSFTIGAYHIVLPTSRDYTESFGVNDRLVGLLLGLAAIFNLKAAKV